MAPILILMVCLGEKAGIIVLPQALRAATIFVLLIALMLTGIPVSIALGLTVLTFLFTLTTVPIEAVSMKLFTGIESFEIMAIPFFILAGNFLTHGGVARRMIDFATSLIGHWHGGLGLAGIVACSMFALVCGSSVATVAAVGAIVLPEMVRHGYPMRFGAGIITVAGSLGILMLPSIPKIIYAVATGTSIGALFVAGLLPGMLLTAMLCVVTWYLARKRDYPRMKKASWVETWHAFRESVWGLMLVVIIIGGIYSGLFTATEAAAMAAVYSFFISVFVYKALKFADVPRVLLRAANTSAMLLYIVTNAVLFSFVLSNENIPSALADWITAQDLGWVGFLLLVNVLLLLAGNFMEPTSIILIMAPILAPAAKRLGIDLVHFGIVIDVNMEVGLCHPPVGLNLYVASMIAGMRITDLAVAVLPWLLTMLVFLVVVTYWPASDAVSPEAARDALGGRRQIPRVDHDPSPDQFAPFRTGALLDRDQPGLVVGLVDNLGRQHDLFRQRLVPDVAHRRACRRAADLEHVEIDRCEDRAGFDLLHRRQDAVDADHDRRSGWLPSAPPARRAPCRRWLRARRRSAGAPAGISPSRAWRRAAGSCRCRSRAPRCRETRQERVCSRARARDWSAPPACLRSRRSCPCRRAFRTDSALAR